MYRQAQATRRFTVKKKASEGDARPIVLFVCVHNAGRSRMAEAFLDQLAGDRFRAMSAGTIPADRPHREVVAAMDQVGVPLRDGPGRMLTQDLANEAIKVIGMGCAVEEACPALQVPLEDWQLDDPKGKSAEEVAEIRDMIEMRVRNLVAKLDREQPAPQ
jgi:arsenate reductase (thioredoxin)